MHSQEILYAKEAGVVNRHGVVVANQIKTKGGLDELETHINPDFPNELIVVL